jgi:hypothetical protein
MLPCTGCAYRKSIPGNCHIGCAFDWSKKPNDVPQNQGSERTSQWFRFPFNYDPTWGPDECAARSETRDEANVAPSNPLIEILSMLG